MGNETHATLADHLMNHGLTAFVWGEINHIFKRLQQ